MPLRVAMLLRFEAVAKNFVRILDVAPDAAQPVSANNHVVDPLYVTAARLVPFVIAGTTVIGVQACLVAEVRKL